MKRKNKFKCSNSNLNVTATIEINTKNLTREETEDKRLMILDEIHSALKAVFYIEQIILK